LENAGEAGLPAAQLALALMFKQGVMSVEKNSDTSWYWMLKAAESNVMLAQFNVARILQRSQKRPSSPEEDYLTWYTKGAFPLFRRDIAI
jgi:TPR repeat protein